MNADPRPRRAQREPQRQRRQAGGRSAHTDHVSKTWQSGSTRAWRRLRAAVLLRDRRCRAHPEGWCARPGVAPHKCTGKAEHAHHTRGRAVTGDDPRHIVAACAPCNQAIGDPSAGGDPPFRPVTQWGIERHGYDR